MDIRYDLEKNYETKYKRFKAIVGTDLWDKILETVDNKEMMGHIIFVNDVMRIPPVKTFIYIIAGENDEYTTTIKQCLGAVFGYIFCELLGYERKENISCRVANFNTATRFIKEDK